MIDPWGDTQDMSLLYSALPYLSPYPFSCENSLFMQNNTLLKCDINFNKESHLMRLSNFHPYSCFPVILPKCHKL